MFYFYEGKEKEDETDKQIILSYFKFLGNILPLSFPLHCDENFHINFDQHFKTPIQGSLNSITIKVLGIQMYLRPQHQYAKIYLQLRFFFSPRTTAQIVFGQIHLTIN